jgi:hypothetical protein
MITLFLERNALGIVRFPGDGSGAFKAPIFGVVLFDTFAVSSTRRKLDIRASQHRSADGDRALLFSDQSSRGGGTARQAD